MYKFNNILVGLDQSSMDYDLIEAACTVCQLSGSQKIYFMNIIRDFHIPDDVKKEFPDIVDKALEQRMVEIKELVNNNFSCPGVEVDYVIKQGQPTKEVMKFSEKEQIDLIVLGRKNERKGGGTVINRVARRAGCSIAVVPKGIKFSIDKMLVPIDYSNYSKLAIEKAIELSISSKKETQIITQNVYQVPSGYHYTGKSFDEFAEIMRRNSQKDYQSFIRTVDLNGVEIETTYTLDKEEDVIGDIYKQAGRKEASIIIIGAKGRTATTALFIGSKAEKLIHMDSDIPIMVIRPKGKTAGFREYIQEL